MATSNENKLNTEELSAASVTDQELKKDENGKLILDDIALGKDEKGFIIPDVLFDKYLKDLPEGTTNESKSYRAYNGGKLARLDTNREEATKRGQAGGIASQSAQQARRTCREILEEIAKRPANSETIDRLGLKEGTSNLEALNYAQYMKAQQGDTKAAEFVRDTIGEKPVNEIAATIETTPEDMELVKRAAARLESGNIE